MDKLDPVHLGDVQLDRSAVDKDFIAFAEKHALTDFVCAFKSPDRPGITTRFLSDSSIGDLAVLLLMLREALTQRIEFDQAKKKMQ